jgi:nitroreductase
LSTHTQPAIPHENGSGERNAIVEVIRTRRTIFNFKPGRPSRDMILRALEVARWAPNHKQTEPWRFRLLGNETAEAIARLNAELVTAKQGEGAGRNKLERWLAVPGWLVVTCVRSADSVREQEDYAACCCAVQNLMLYLWSEGVGTKWTTGDVTRDPRCFDLLDIDRAREMIVGLIWYGYPDEVPKMQRKPVEQLVRELP